VIGSEVELALAATDNLRLAVNYGLASTKLKDYESVIDQTSGVAHRRCRRQGSPARTQTHGDDISHLDPPLR
jgi:hypothetical protein